MNECVVITGGLLCLVAAVGYGIALGTSYWHITALQILGANIIHTHQGLFQSGCANIDCSTFGKVLGIFATYILYCYKCIQYIQYTNVVVLGLRSPFASPNITIFICSRA